MGQMTHPTPTARRGWGTRTGKQSLPVAPVLIGPYS